MSNSIVNNFVDEFNENLQLLSQQQGSRLRKAVNEAMHVGEGASAADQLAAAVAQRRTTRHAAKPIIETTHSRRWVYPVDYDWGDVVDNEDKLRLKISPEGGYTKTGLAAINRAMDDEIIGSFFASSNTGVRGADTTAHPSSRQVAVTVGASTDTGLNTDKLLAARELIMAANVDLDEPGNELFCAINANYEHQLLEQIKVGNSDYNKAIFAGNGKVLGSWFGITFIHTERLDTDSSSDVRVPFWCKSGMHLGIWKDVTGNITQRNDLTRDPYHVSTCGTFGATRLEEVKVVEIICDPS